MDLVRGIPITDFCDQERLSPRHRLKLFVSVCQAVQHAHHKGIIHRDLKPSNILVTLHDGVPVPKVIDFGVAKAVGQQLTDKTLYTNIAQMIGTPLYMSPEQAQLTGLDVDTRSDIYSLGVLLYELLTGTTPFQKERLKSVPFDEIRRIIREEEPPKPSTRISTLAGDATALSALRHSDPRRLSLLLRGELDWIVMKCLEKDRNRRYQTANGLAADVERYLHDEPVEAGPPSTWYRLQKFARRNQAALLTATLVLFLVVAGLTISTLMIAQERDKAQAAAQEAQEQKAEAQEQRAAAVRQSTLADIKAEEAEKERKRAETNFQRSREVVDRFLTRAAEDMADKPHMEKVRRALLEDALKFYQEFLEQKGTDALIRHETARAYLRVAQIQQWLWNTAQVEAPARSAITLLQQLSAEHRASKEYWQDLAEAHDALAASLDHRIRLEDALAEYRSELAVWEHLAADFPAVGNYRRRVAAAHSRIGHTLFRLFRYEEAEKEYRSTHDLLEQLHREFPNESDDRETMRLYWTWLGELLRRWNRLHEAEHAYREALRFAPENWSADANAILAEILIDTGKPEESERLYRQALAAWEKLADDFPSVGYYRFKLWDINLGLAHALCAMNRTQEGVEAYQRGLLILRKMLADQPHDLKLLVDVGATYYELGLALDATRRSREATDAFRQAQELTEKGLTGASETPVALLNLAELLANCPATQFRDPTRAVQFAQRALQRSPAFDGWSTLGSALYRANRWNEAIEALQKAMEAGNGGSACDWFFLAMAYRQRGDSKEARKWYDKAVGGMKKYPSWPFEEHQCRAEAAALLGVANQPKPKEKANPPPKP
jgi:tetratricopeptide (TPR) repeat protein